MAQHKLTIYITDLNLDIKMMHTRVILDKVTISHQQNNVSELKNSRMLKTEITMTIIPVL